MKHLFENITIKLLYLWLFFSLVVFTFFIPPFQKPDEINHFHRGIALVKGEFFCKGGITNGYFLIPYNFYYYPNHLSANVIKYHYNDKFPLNTLLTRQTSGPDKKVTWLCLLPFTGYISNAPGLEIGLLFNNPLLAIYLGRLSSGIIFIFCVFIALKIIPSKYKSIIYLYAVIPMVMHQATAISYDTLQLSLIIIIFSLFLKFISLKKLTKKHLFIFIILLVLFALAKTGYYPILLLYFLLPYKKMPHKFFYYFIPAFTIIIVIIGLAIISSKIIFSSQTHTGLINPQLQMHYLLLNPMAPLHILISSYQKYGEFYYQSFIGFFGWLDYKMNFLIYEIFAVIIAFVIYFLIKINTTPVINKKQLLLLFIIIFATVGLIFSSQYLNWTPVASYVVEGVQGRYFLVLLPITIFAIVQYALHMGKRNFYILLSGGFIIFLVIDILFNIYSRYYNYQNIYLNDHPYKNVLQTLSEPSTHVQIIPLKQTYTFVVKNILVDKSIDGFNMIFQTNDENFTTSYEYTIKDAVCKKILKHSFLDLNKLQDKVKPTVYDEKFTTSIDRGNKRLCISIGPFSNTKNADYISLLSLDNVILFQPLYNR